MSRLAEWTIERAAIRRAGDTLPLAPCAWPRLLLPCSAAATWTGSAARRFMGQGRGGPRQDLYDKGVSAVPGNPGAQGGWLWLCGAVSMLWSWGVASQARFWPVFWHGLACRCWSPRRSRASGIVFAGRALTRGGWRRQLAWGRERCSSRPGRSSWLGTRVYEAREPVQADRWAATSPGGLNEAGFPHPRLQEAAFCWAESVGAAVRRPMKVTGFSGSGVATVAVTRNGRVEQVQARLVVGADGKMGNTRRWTGGQSAADPEHHRFGGVAVSGVRTDDRDTDNLGGDSGPGGELVRPGR